MAYFAIIFIDIKNKNMADSDNTNKKDEQKLVSDIDPKVEKKVDAMMAPDSPDKSDHNLPKALSGAPLLPDEKLPDFPDKFTEPTSPQPAEPAKASKPDISDHSSIDDPETDKAVDEISEQESDRMLAIEDAKAELLAEGTAEIDRGFWNRLKTKFVDFWHNKKARNSSIAGLIVLVFIAVGVPTSRYFILNSFGVRASMSLRVIDDKTDQPLKNVVVSINGESGKTDIDGKVKLEKIHLGRQQLSVSKPAFADSTQNITVGWGSNPLGDVALQEVGSRYVFELKDFVSGKPLADGEVVSGEASANANEQGEAVLVVADQNQAQISVQVRAPDYRTETFNLDVGDKEVRNLGMVPARKHAFVSKRSGKYDLYKVDVDGKNEQLVLAGAGAESENTTVILPSLHSDTIAYVSTRGDKHNEDGFPLAGLKIINLDDNKIQTIDYSEKIQLVDFIGSKLVYVKIEQGQSAASPNRNQLISYDVSTNEKKLLAKTNYFNDVLSAKGAIYYAPSQYKTSGIGLFKVNPDGSGQTMVYDKEVWNLFRVSYDKIDAAVGQNWYEYDTVTDSFNALNSAPPEQKSRIYADSPDGKKSAWVDNRDGKGVLLVYDTSTGEDKAIQTQSGLTNPISWLDNDHLVYRVYNTDETADYVVSLSGGSPKKIEDVTNVAGLDRWYYY